MKKKSENLFIILMYTCINYIFCLVLIDLINDCKNCSYHGFFENFFYNGFYVHCYFLKKYFLV